MYDYGRTISGKPHSPHLGLFEFCVLPFCLQEVLGMFMNFINEVLRKFLYGGVLIYLDDILIYLNTLEEHIALVREVMQRLAANHLYAKFSKCKFH